MKFFSTWTDAIKSAEKQDQLIIWSIVGSVVFHILIIAGIEGEWWSTRSSPIIEEWSIDTELVTDINLEASNQTVIPGAKESEEVSVPSNLLPQVTKRYTVKEQEKQEEGLVEEPLEPDVEKGKNATKDTVKDKPMVKPDPDVSTKIQQQDALRRMALEKLRREQKEQSRELKAHKNDKLAQIREALSEGAALDQSAGGGLIANAESRRYQGYLSQTIRRNYELPSNYQFQSSKTNVILLMRINARGELLTVDISESSGDQVRDAYSIEAVKKSAPFNPPPKALAGRDFLLNFQLQ
ncbi:MAG: cell envelope integrity protein TolA [Oligoflexus sp.]